MAKSFITLSLSVLMAVCLQAQTPANARQGEVNQVITRFFDGIAALDKNMISQTVTDNFMLLEDGAIWNMDTIANKISQLKATSFSRINQLHFIQTEIKENTAWVAYNNIADMTINGQKIHVQWLESAVLVKANSQWKITLLHSTPLKP